VDVIQPLIMPNIVFYNFWSAGLHAFDISVCSCSHQWMRLGLPRFLMVKLVRHAGSSPLDPLWAVSIPPLERGLIIGLSPPMILSVVHLGVPCWNVFPPPPIIWLVWWSMRVARIIVGIITAIVLDHPGHCKTP
jgi:hypothetical protein